MASFDDLVVLASERGGALWAVRRSVIEGKSWQWNVDAATVDGVEVDMTGVTAECKVLDEIGGSVVATGTVTADGNGWQITFAPGVTAGLAGSGKQPVQRPWYFTLTNGAGRKVAVWGVHYSTLSIHQGE